jgi:hypothetical protein
MCWAPGAPDARIARGRHGGAAYATLEISDDGRVRVTETEPGAVIRAELGERFSFASTPGAWEWRIRTQGKPRLLTGTASALSVWDTSKVTYSVGVIRSGGRTNYAA